MSLVSDGGRFVRLWRCRLLSVPLEEHASGKRWDGSGMGHVARKCFGTIWYSDVPGAPGTRNGDTDTEDNSSFAAFLNLTNKLCVLYAWTSGFGSDFDMFRVLKSLRRPQKFEDT